MKYIKRQLISENYKGRSNNVSIENAISIFKENCSDYDFKAPKIYRGIRHTKKLGKFAVVSPSEYKRMGGYSNTTYLNLIDGSDAWKDYPKRRESIICSTSETTAHSFGRTYIVIPYNNAIFGVCPSYDFQVCFSDFSKIFGFKLHRLDNLFLGNSSRVYDYNEIKKKIEEKDINMVEFSYAYKQHIIDNNISGRQIFNHMLELSAPERNNFKIVHQSDIEVHNLFTLGRELWTDSDCLLIDSSYYDKFLEQVGISADII